MTWDLPCGCTYQPGIDLPISECGPHAADATLAHRSLTGGSTETADREPPSTAHTDGPKPYLCGCPSDDPRPCPLHDREPADPAQGRET